MELRPYQNLAIKKVFEDLCTRQTSLLVLPCGLGKTEIFIAMIKEILAKRPTARICILLNKIQLLEQTVERVEKELGEVSVFCGSLNKKCLKRNITVASIQSISKVDAHFELVISDEAHMALSSEYIKFFDRCKTVNPKVKFFGCTATPYADNEPIYGDDKFYQSPCYELPVTYGIDNNYLVRPILKGSTTEFDTSKLRTVMGDYDKKQVQDLVLDTNKTDDQVCDALNQTLDRKKIIWFCASIEHAKMVSENLFKYGEDNAIYHSEMSYDEKKLAEDKFETTACRHLVFITICVQGYNYPPIDALIILRPTKSVAMYIQVVGRTLRTSQGKENSLILDYGQVVKNCGSLDKPILKKKFSRSLTEEEKEEINPLKKCPVCFTYQERNTQICDVCGHEFLRKITLTKKAENNYSILAQDEEIDNIQKITIEKHTSKSGNLCLRIDYHYKIEKLFNNLLVFSEFYALHSEFAVKKLSKRWDSIAQGELIDSVESLARYERGESQVHFIVPKKLIIETDKNNYRKIKKMIF